VGVQYCTDSFEMSDTGSVRLISLELLIILSSLKAVRISLVSSLVSKPSGTDHYTVKHRSLPASDQSNLHLHVGLLYAHPNLVSILSHGISNEPVILLGVGSKSILKSHLVTQIDIINVGPFVIIP
jgi:hypothetical protein